MHFPLLQDILILLGFSVAIVFILQKIKLPSIIGFLLTGIIIGPYGFSLITAIEQVDILSEIGVILLLFVIGMELSIKQLVSIKRTVFIGGFLQVGVTVGVAALVYHFLGNSWSEAVFVGFLFSLSSTAIVLKTLQDRQEISTPHARNALAILIFQDIIVVPMMLVTPMLAGESADITISILSLLFKSAIVVLITYVGARHIIPKLMYAIARTKNKELFLLVTITLCFAIAFLTAEIGLSLALGAFIAGLIISESEYSHQATSIILPFRELFTSFFFVSVGMLLDLNFFINHIPIILLLVFIVLIVKSAIATVAVAVLKHPMQSALLTGLALCQVGEFAFVLSKIGISYKLLTIETNQYFLSVSIVSMILTPFIVIFSRQLTVWILNISHKTGFDKIITPKTNNDVNETSELSNHLVIIGYGINGRNLAKAAMSTNVPYIVIELDADKVKRARENGVNIIFGDATRSHILETVRISDARAAVIAISENRAVQPIVKSIRTQSDSLYLIARTRHTGEISHLLALGADEVIPEGFETSIQIFSHILHNFLIPEHDIDQLIDRFRSHHYQLLHNKFQNPRTFKPTEIAEFNITCLRVNTDSTKIVGKSLKDLDLRANYGINILTIKRDDNMLESVLPDEVIKQGDIVYVVGNQPQIEEFYQLVN